MAISIEVNEDRHEVKAGERVVNLSPKEYEILLMLAKSGGGLLTRQEIIKALWPEQHRVGIDTRTVDQHIARLRRALGVASHCIQTVTNYGYKGVGIVFVESHIINVKIVSPIARKFGKFPKSRALVEIDGLMTESKKGDVLRLAQ